MEVFVADFPGKWSWRVRDGGNEGTWGTGRWLVSSLLRCARVVWVRAQCLPPRACIGCQEMSPAPVPGVPPAL